MPDQEVHVWLETVRHILRLDKLPSPGRKIIVCVIGGTLVIAGIIMVATPGPAVVVIPLGLLFLATEFNWAAESAQKILNYIRQFRRNRRQKRATRR